MFILIKNHVLFGKKGRLVSKSFYNSLESDHKELFKEIEKNISKSLSEEEILAIRKAPKPKYVARWESHLLESEQYFNITLSSSNSAPELTNSELKDQIEKLYF